MYLFLFRQRVRRPSFRPPRSLQRRARTSRLCGAAPTQRSTRSGACSDPSILVRLCSLDRKNGPGVTQVINRIDA
jgi:hypothetical protein